MVEGSAFDAIRIEIGIGAGIGGVGFSSPNLPTPPRLLGVGGDHEVVEGGGCGKRR